MIDRPRVVGIHDSVAVKFVRVPSPHDEPATVLTVFPVLPNGGAVIHNAPRHNDGNADSLAFLAAVAIVGFDGAFILIRPDVVAGATTGVEYGM